MSKHLDIERQAAAWLARKDSGNWSAVDQAQLDQWFALATAHRVAYLRLATAWSRAGSITACATGPAAPAAQRDQVPAQAEPRSLPRFSQ